VLGLLILGCSEEFIGAGAGDDVKGLEGLVGCLVGFVLVDDVKAAFHQVEGAAYSTVPAVKDWLVSLGDFLCSLDPVPGGAFVDTYLAGGALDGVAFAVYER